MKTRTTEYIPRYVQNLKDVLISILHFILGSVSKHIVELQITMARIIYSFRNNRTYGCREGMGHSAKINCVLKFT